MREGNGRFNQRRVARKEKMRKDRRRGAGWWKQETDILSEAMQSVSPSRLEEEEKNYQKL